MSNRLTDNKAKKILDFLCRRWEKATHIKQEAHILRLGRGACSIFAMIDFMGVFLSQCIYFQCPEHVFLNYDFKKNAIYEDKDLLCILLEYAKMNDVFLQHTPFIFKGETVEELQVNANLVEPYA